VLALRLIEMQNEDVKLKSLEAIFGALQEADARYIVVGGLAVVAHGHVRTTQDVDLVLDLSADSLQRALNAFHSLEYRPLIPVSINDFANPELRRDWIENRNMKVFNLVSDRYPDTVIDIFPKEPFSFEAEFARAELKNVTPNIQARVAAIPALIALKIEANRPIDIDDISKLRKLQELRES
jgi:hypothetical protein